MFEPKLGDKVYLSPLSPFDTIINADVPYIYSGKNLIQTLIEESVNVYEEVYKPMNIGHDLYLEDMNANVPILTLMRNATSKISVPMNYISFGKNSDIEYVVQGLGFKIDKLPVNVDLEPLKIDIENLIISTLGIRPSSTLALLSSPIRITYDDHIKFDNDRKTIIGNYKPFSTERMELLQRIDELESDKQILIDKIKNG